MEPTGNFGGMSPQKLLKNRQAIADLAGSEDARQLMELLQRQGGQVRQAAQQAAAGSPDKRNRSSSGAASHRAPVRSRFFMCASLSKRMGSAA